MSDAFKPGSSSERTRWLSILSQCLPADFLDAVDAGKRHGDVELVLEDFDRAGHSDLAAGPEAIQIRAADHAGTGAERERPRDVLTGANAAVEHDLDVGADRIDDPRQHRDRGDRTIELTPAVVGDDERGSSGLGGAAGVLDVEQSLDDQLAGPQLADPFDILPGERRIELAGDPLRQRADALHAAHPSGEVAEGLALAGEDADRPSGPLRDIDHIGELDLRRHRHAVAQVAVALP